MGEYVIRETKSGVKFDLKASNGEVILTSEVYSSVRSCRSGIASVMRNAPIAATEDQTVEDYERQKCPKFEVYTDKAGETRFRLKAKNGQIIGTGEGYAKKASCIKGIASIRKNAVSGNRDTRAPR
ncbi:MAG: YegP family protein [Oscillospiraceae bacterium]|nr:YegP family protein [Oscillospiraceae bacterium]